jgi:hypothetical protein
MARRKKKRSPLEDLLGVNVGQLGSVASAFMAGVETFAGPQKRLFDQMSQFAAHFSQAAVQKWASQGPLDATCSMQGCGGDAVMRCLGCGHPICLAHAHVSHRAEGLCDQCVRDLMQMKGADAPRPGRYPTGPEVRAALKTLGLHSKASWPQIQRAHRKLAAQYHPDRAPSESARELLEARVKRINAAFEVLQRHHERKQAA